jgi:hypothetical protein
MCRGAEFLNQEDWEFVRHFGIFFNRLTAKGESP